MAEEHVSPPARGSSAESLDDESPDLRDPGSRAPVWLTLRRRVTGALLILALIPLIGLSLLTYQRERDSRTEEAIDRLLAVAAVQEARIESIVREDFDVDLPSTQGRTELLNLLSAYLETGTQADSAVLNDQVRHVRDSSGTFSEVLIVDFGGIVIAAGDADRIGTDLSGNAAVLDARFGNRLGGWSEVAAGKLVHTVAGPLEIDGTPRAILLIEGDGEDLSNLVGDYTGLGETGETVVAIRDERGDALFITQLRFDPGAAFTRRVARTALGVPMTQALLGNEALFRASIDYRDEPVLAATRYIPDADLGIVVKLDTSEAFAAVANLRRSLVVGVAAIALVVSLVAILLARSIVDPISKLRDAARAVADGNLDARAVITGNDEVGELAYVFNQMADTVAFDRRKLEQRVDAQTEELSRALVDLERFSSAAAHDLQEPLRKIAVFGGRLETVAADTLSDQGKQYVERMTDAAERMQRLVDRLLAYSRVTTRAAAFTHVELAEVVDSALADLAEIIIETGAVVEVADLPAIEADRAQLRQVFRTIIANSLQYVRPGEPPSVWISADFVADHQLATRGRVCRIVIDDDGTGFDVEDSERIFEGFIRLEARGSETGMGLAICRRIVERHSGTISAASTLGQGAAFTIMIPAAQETE